MSDLKPKLFSLDKPFADYEAKHPVRAGDFIAKNNAKARSADFQEYKARKEAEADEQSQPERHSLGKRAAAVVTVAGLAAGAGVAINARADNDRVFNPDRGNPHVITVKMPNELPGDHSQTQIEVKTSARPDGN